MATPIHSYESLLQRLQDTAKKIEIVLEANRKTANTLEERKHMTALDLGVKYLNSILIPELKEMHPDDRLKVRKLLNNPGFLAGTVEYIAQLEDIETEIKQLQALNDPVNLLPSTQIPTIETTNEKLKEQIANRAKPKKKEEKVDIQNDMLDFTEEIGNLPLKHQTEYEDDPFGEDFDLEESSPKRTLNPKEKEDLKDTISYLENKRDQEFPKVSVLIARSVNYLSVMDKSLNKVQKQEAPQSRVRDLITHFENETAKDASTHSKPTTPEDSPKHPDKKHKL